MNTPSAKDITLESNRNCDFSTSQAEECTSDFKLERYKYILQQLHTLNENKYFDKFRVSYD
jgi:hypothetical protein